MKILVIGCGSVGIKHIENAIEFAKIGVLDINKESTLKTEKYEITKNFGDDFDAAFSWSPDGIIIATPNNTHVEIAKKCILKNFHVLIEKPIGLNLIEVDELLNLSVKKKRKILVVSNLRFNKFVQIIRNNIYLIGKPLYGNFFFGHYLPFMRQNIDYTKLYVATKEQGGVILDCIHEIDYVQWIFGKGKLKTSKRFKLSDLNILSEDYATISIEHESGFLSEIQLDFIRKTKQRGCCIYGSDGIIEWQSLGKNPSLDYVRLLKPNRIENIINDETLVDDTFKSVIKEFIKELNGETSNLQTGLEARRNLLISLEARSMKIMTMEK